MLTSFCRVMDDLTVKLTDLALSRDLFPQDYDCLESEGPDESRPLKFMAMESIQDRRFSTASDVVSIVVMLSNRSLTLLFSGPLASFCGN
jgi:RYK receptor-like tyrosine kinase